MQVGFNQESAMKAGSETTTIDRSGAFKAVIEKAIEHESQNGAKGIRFSFTDKTTGLSATSILYLYKTTGEEIAFTHNFLQALMGLLNITSVKTEMGTVREYDRDAQGEVDKRLPIFPDLVGKHIGVCLQRVQYAKNNGDLGWQFNIKNFYHAKTNQTYREVIENKEAEQYKRDIEVYQDKLLDTAPQTGGTGFGSQGQQSGGAGFGSSQHAKVTIEDDMIPF